MALNHGEQVTITDFLGQSRQYAVIRPLGDGYLADVYLMRDLHTSDPVVAKVLKERHVNAPGKTDDFLREADFLQQLAHRPEVVRLQAPGKGEITVNERGRLPCILQEYIRVPYRPLPELVEEGLEERTSLEICRQFVSLLNYAHTLGIIYADLKPEHIYWNGAQIKVIDWNVAKDLSTADDDALREAVVKELATFGQVMYFLFTGRATVCRLEGPSITTLLSHRSSDTHIDFENRITRENLSDPEGPSGLQGLSLGTKLIVERSLEEVRDGRYPSAAALEQALAQQILRLSRTGADRIAHTRAALSKGLAALEAGDCDDAVGYFEEAVYGTPGLITQSHLVAARVRQSNCLSEPAKDQIEGNLALFRMAFQEGDLATALDALASSQTTAPNYRDLEILHQLASQVAQAVTRAEEALVTADYTTAQQALQRAASLESSASFLQERLQAVEAFKTHLQTGEQALQAAQFDEAATAFDTLLSHMPRSESIEQRWLTAKLGQARAALERKAYTDARRAFEAILERQSDNADAHAGLAAIEEALQRMQRLESRLSQGHAAFRAGDYEKALQHIHAVFELDPEHSGARQLLADVQQAQQVRRSRRVRRLLEKGQQAMAEEAYAEAIQCFEQAAALDPESEASILRARAEAAQARTNRYQALLHKAHAAFRGEDYDAAVQYFEEAIDLHPEALDARRGLTLARQRQAEVRVQEIQSLLARGRAALSAGHFDDALRHFERASELGAIPSLRRPESAEGSLGGDVEIADYIEKTFRLRDLVQNAHTAEENGDFQAALSYYAQAIETEPLPGLERQWARLRDRAQAANRRRIDQLIERALEHLESAPDQAVALLEQVQELDPDHEQVAELLPKAQEQLQRWRAEFHRLLEAGEAALRAGDGVTAERIFADALTMDPQHMQAQASFSQARRLQQHLAAAQSATGRKEYEHATAELARAVEIAPESTHLQRLLQQAQCDTLLQRARRAADAGDYTEALGLIDQALAVHSDYAAPHALTQAIRAEAEAARRAEEVVAYQARLHQVRDLMATADARIETCDYHAAIQAIEAALELVPDSPELASRRREVAQEKARYDRARALMDQARLLEVKHQYAQAAETYEIAARLTPDPGVEAEAQARAIQARHHHRQQRWQRLLRRIVGFPLHNEEETGFFT